MENCSFLHKCPPNTLWPQPPYGARLQVIPLRGLAPGKPKGILMLRPIWPSSHSGTAQGLPKSSARLTHAPKLLTRAKALKSCSTRPQCLPNAALKPLRAQGLPKACPSCPRAAEEPPRVCPRHSWSCPRASQGPQACSGLTLGHEKLPTRPRMCRQTSA